MKTYAGNPGKLRVNRWRLIRHEPFWPLTLFVCTVGLIVLARLSDQLVYALGAVIGFALFWIYIVFYFMGRERQFRDGDVNISKIISLSPPLFATSTNMQTGMDRREYPVVKIVRGRVPNARSLSWRVGDYFAAACLYSGSGRSGHWDDFDPLPISMATDRVEVLLEQVERLAYLQRELDLRISLVKNTRRTGIYFLSPEKLAALRAESSPR